MGIIIVAILIIICISTATENGKTKGQNPSRPTSSREKRGFTPNFTHLNHSNESGLSAQSSVNAASQGQRNFSYMDSFEIGTEFELKICQLLLSEGFHRIIHNVWIPAGEYSTAQIDIVLVTSAGVFCIECKYWSGVIFGDSNWNRWCSVREFDPYRYYRVYESIPLQATELYNPIKQNAFHCTHLKKLLHTLTGKSIPVFNTIVLGELTNTNYLNAKRGSNSYDIVNSEKLIRLIHDIISSRPVVISEEDAETLETSLLSYGQKFHG